MLPVETRPPNRTNVPAVAEAFARMSERGNTERLLKLTLRDGKTIAGVLKFVAENTRGKREADLTVYLSLQYNSKLLSQLRHDWVLEESKIFVNTFIDTYSPWEGNGFGTALLSQNSPVITYTFTRSPDWKHLPVLASIIDNSKGIERPRNMWTTSMVKQLPELSDYMPYQNAFDKRYR